jgi:hypothetical protein
VIVSSLRSRAYLLSMSLVHARTTGWDEFEDLLAS